MRTCTLTQTCTGVLTRTPTHPTTQIFARTYLHTYTHTYMHTCTHAHAHLLNTHTCTCTCTRRHTHTIWATLLALDWQCALISKAAVSSSRNVGLEKIYNQSFERRALNRWRRGCRQRENMSLGISKHLTKAVPNCTPVGFELYLFL